MAIPAYLILGSANSARRATIFNILKNAEEKCAILIAESEKPSDSDAKVSDLKNLTLLRYSKLDDAQEILSTLPQEIEKIFVIADSNLPLADSVEAFKKLVDVQLLDLARVLGFLDCRALHQFPRECADFVEEISHFCDCVIFTRRSNIPNKVVSELCEKWRKQCKPLITALADKNCEVPNPEELLVDEARRICMIFDDIDPIYELDIDEDNLPEEPFSLERKPDPYLQRMANGMRAKPVENISLFLADKNLQNQ